MSWFPTSDSDWRLANWPKDVGTSPEKLFSVKSRCNRTGRRAGREAGSGPTSRFWDRSRWVSAEQPRSADDDKVELSSLLESERKVR